MRYFVLLNTYVTLGLQKHLFLIKLDITYLFILSNYVWKLRYNNVAFWFLNLPYLFLRQNNVINAFPTFLCFSNIINVSHDIKITFFCGTFTLRIKKTLQLRFVFVQHSKLFPITSQLRYLFVRCSYLFYGNRITLYFGMMNKNETKL